MHKIHIHIHVCMVIVTVIIDWEGGGGGVYLWHVAVEPTLTSLQLFPFFTTNLMTLPYT